MARTIEHFGGVDILVNNANDCKPGPLLSVTDEDFERSFATGPLATLRLMRACYPSMKERGGGSIINLVTSAAVRWDASNYGAYAATKEGMRSLTRAAACEWGIDGIRVNAIAPHALSPALEWWINEYPEEAEEFKAGIPLRRIGDPESDIGRAVVFLVSNDAGYLSGATIPLDAAVSPAGADGRGRTARPRPDPGPHHRSGDRARRRRGRRRLGTLVRPRSRTASAVRDLLPVSTWSWRTGATVCRSARPRPRSAGTCG